MITTVRKSQNQASREALESTKSLCRKMEKLALSNVDKVLVLAELCYFGNYIEAQHFYSLLEQLELRISMKQLLRVFQRSRFLKRPCFSGILHYSKDSKMIEGVLYGVTPAGRERYAKSKKKLAKSAWVDHVEQSSSVQH